MRSGRTRSLTLSESDRKIIAENRKARFNYFIEDTYEAGLVLQGTEVKALRQGRANLKDAYAKIENGEVWLHQMHISVYDHAYYGNHDPLRPRKLLLHKSEIEKLFGKVNEMGRTLVPLSLYFVKGKVKVKLALARGKHAYDKRDSIRRRDEQREMDRAHSER